MPAAPWARTHPAWLGCPCHLLLCCDEAAWPSWSETSLCTPAQPGRRLSVVRRTSSLPLTLFQQLGKTWAQDLHLLGTKLGSHGAAQTAPLLPRERARGRWGLGVGRGRCCVPRRTWSSPRRYGTALAGRLTGTGGDGGAPGRGRGRRWRGKGGRG